jgi:hypothetical protein
MHLAVVLAVMVPLALAVTVGPVAVLVATRLPQTVASPLLGSGATQVAVVVRLPHAAVAVVVRLLWVRLGPLVALVAPERPTRSRAHR